MKATRKLIPAIAMLLISAVMMSTATFAWFSSNANVSVDGMQITAKSDNIFITISNSADNTQNTATELLLSPTVTGTLLPVKATATNSGFTWETGVGKNANDGSIQTDEEGNKKYTTITPGEDDAGLKDVYAIRTTFYIRTATGFPSASDLKLASIVVTDPNTEDSVDLSDFHEAISVAIVAEDKNTGKTVYHVYNDCDVDNTVLAPSVTSTKDIVITAYIFINGENSVVKSALATADNMTAMSITLNFTAGAASN